MNSELGTLLDAVDVARETAARHSQSIRTTDAHRLSGYDLVAAIEASLLAVSDVDVLDRAAALRRELRERCTPSLVVLKLVGRHVTDDELPLLVDSVYEQEFELRRDVRAIRAGLGDDTEHRKLSDMVEQARTTSWAAQRPMPDAFNSRAALHLYSMSIEAFTFSLKRSIEL